MHVEEEPSTQKKEQVQKVQRQADLSGRWRNRQEASVWLEQRQEGELQEMSSEGSRSDQAKSL